MIYLVGVPYGRFELHPLLMKKALDGVCAENVERVLLMGTVYPYGLPTKGWELLALVVPVDGVSRDRSGLGWLARDLCMARSSTLLDS